MIQPTAYPSQKFGFLRQAANSTHKLTVYRQPPCIFPAGRTVTKLGDVPGFDKGFCLFFCHSNNLAPLESGEGCLDDVPQRSLTEKLFKFIDVGHKSSLEAGRFLGPRDLETFGAVEAGKGEGKIPATPAAHLWRVGLRGAHWLYIEYRPVCGLTRYRYKS
jgi:hypothetical protein